MKIRIIISVIISVMIMFGMSAECSAQTHSETKEIDVPAGSSESITLNVKGTGRGSHPVSFLIRTDISDGYMVVYDKDYNRIDRAEITEGRASGTFSVPDGKYTVMIGNNGEESGSATAFFEYEGNAAGSGISGAAGDLLKIFGGAVVSVICFLFRAQIFSDIHTYSGMNSFSLGRDYSKK